MAYAILLSVALECPRFIFLLLRWKVNLFLGAGSMNVKAEVGLR
jgi:hypothetical protein